MKNEKENQKPNDKLANADLEKVVGGSLLSTAVTVINMISDMQKSTISNIRA